MTQMAIEEDSTGFGHMVTDWRAGFTVETHPAGALVRAESSFVPAVEAGQGAPDLATS